jgi:superfamily I DNA and/or RNA helicase
LRDGEIAELQAIAKDGAALRDVADMGLRLFEPFRTFVEEDARRVRTSANHRAISATLTEQRRMDPGIARIVSAAFYDGNLLTQEDRAQAADNDPPPFVVADGLPRSPVVVVDFKHVSATGAASPAERSRPRFHNP